MQRNITKSYMCMKFNYLSYYFKQSVLCSSHCLVRNGDGGRVSSNSIVFHMNYVVRHERTVFLCL